MSSTETTDYRNDSRYRRYAAAVDKTLQTFEQVDEWADIISFLARLSKTLASYPQFAAIPKKLLVSKRLAQCLNPALPAGVHQKTLEVYDLIFQKIGTEGLSKDLPIYSLGLFPFFEYATTLARKPMLELFEASLIPLGPRLLPCLQSLLLAFLPGLEEDSGEHFDKVFKLMDALRKAVGTREFYSAMWMSLYISARHRLAAINYLLRALPQKMDVLDLNSVCAGKQRLVVDALCVALADRNSLVIRGALDVILIQFPLTDHYFKDDALEIKLALAAISVLLKRDMSLSRRLYGWVLGPSETADISDDAIEVVAGAIRLALSVESDDLKELTKPYKLLSFILDKSTIAKPVIVNLASDLVATLSRQTLGHSELKSQLVHSANAFFEYVELGLIWNRLCQMAVGIEDEATRIELLLFAVENLSICDQEAAKIQLPLALYAVSSKINESQHAMTRIALCMSLQKKISNRQISWTHLTRSAADELLAAFLTAPSAIVDCGDDLACLMVLALDTWLSYGSSRIRHCEIDRELLEGLCILIASVLGDCENPILMDESLLLTSLEQWIGLAQDFCLKIKDIRRLEIVTDHLMKLDSLNLPQTRSAMSNGFIQKLVPRLWNHFDVSSTEVVNLIWALYVYTKAEVDNYVSRCLASEDATEKTYSLCRFSQFWTTSDALDIPCTAFTQSLLVALDAIDDPNPAVRRAVETWISWSLEKCNRLIDPLLDMLTDSLDFIDASEDEVEGRLRALCYSSPPNAAQTLYVIQKISALQRCGGARLSLFLRRSNAPATFNYDAIESLPIELIPITSACTYAQLLIAIMTPLAVTESGQKFSAKVCLAIDQLQNAAVDFMFGMLSTLDGIRAEELQCLCHVLVTKIRYLVQKDELERPEPLLRLLLRAVSTTAKVAKSSGTISPKKECALASPELKHLCDVCCVAIENCSQPEVLRCWVDFSMLLSAEIDDPIDSILLPVLNSLQDRLRESVAAIYRAMTVGGDSATPVLGPKQRHQATAPSNHLLKELLGSLEKIMKIGLLGGPLISTPAETLLRRGRSASLQSSWSGYVHDMIQQPRLSEQIDWKGNVNPLVLQLPSVIELLHLLWGGVSSGNSADEFTAQIRRILHVFYVTHPFLCLRGFLEFWTPKGESGFDFKADASIVEMVNALNGSFSTEIGKHIMVIYRILSPQSRDRALATSKIKVDAVLSFLLMISYHGSEDVFLIDMLAYCADIMRESLANVSKFRSVFHLILQWAVCLVSKILANGSNEARRLVRDQQDLIQRLCEHCVGVAAKLADVSMWIRAPPELDHHLQMSENGLPFPEDVITASSRDKHAAKILITVCSILIPALASMFVDNDRMVSVYGSFVSTIFVPNVRNRPKTHFMGYLAISTLARTAELTTLARAWKKEYWDYVMDQRLFNMPRFHLDLNVKILGFLIRSEPERLQEVVAKIPPSHASAIFLSKEAETLNRAIMVRRLSLAIFSSAHDQCRSDFHLIQERIADLLRTPVGLVTAEIFFLLRVLIIRVSDKVLASLWPIVLTEMMQLFQSVVKSKSSLTDDQLYALLHACKLLELMIVAPTSDTFIYNWIFLQAPQHTSGLLDIVSAHIGAMDNDPVELARLEEFVRKRRPMLRLRKINSVKDLKPFFMTAGVHLREENVTEHAPDYADIEEMIRDEFIDE